VKSSSELGLVKLLSETSIGAGVRRVEALVGADAFNFLAREHVLLNSLTELIKGSRVEELPEAYPRTCLSVCARSSVS
jgi:alanyl-tRNA synthetase